MQTTTEKTEEEVGRRSTKDSMNFGIYAMSAALPGYVSSEAIVGYGVDPKWVIVGAALAASGVTASNRHLGPWIAFSTGCIGSAAGILTGADPTVASFVQSPVGVIAGVALVSSASAVAASAEVNEGNHFFPPLIGTTVGCAASALMAFMAVSGGPSQPVVQPTERDVTLACDVVKAGGSEILTPVAGKNGESLALVMPADCIPK